MGKINYHGHTIEWRTEKRGALFVSIVIVDGHEHGVQAEGLTRKAMWRVGKRIAEAHYNEVIRPLVIADALAKRNAPKPRQHIQPLQTWDFMARAKNDALLRKIAFTKYERTG